MIIYVSLRLCLCLSISLYLQCHVPTWRVSLKRWLQQKPLHTSFGIHLILPCQLSVHYLSTQLIHFIAVLLFSGSPFLSWCLDMKDLLTHSNNINVHFFKKVNMLQEFVNEISFCNPQELWSCGAAGAEHSGDALHHRHPTKTPHS